MAARGFVLNTSCFAIDIGIDMKLIKSLRTVLIGCTALFMAFANAQPVEVNKDSFKCLTEMTPVRGFFVDNLLGDLEATLAAAKSTGGAVYPAGSVVQLVPTEVMVKREKGYNATTKDWEFFELAVSATGSEITVHGAFEVVNKFGGNCFGCHIKAKPQWDMICEQDHGCDPITFKHEGKEVVLTQDMIKGVQKADPRCVLPDGGIVSL
ncbi:MAG: hypothetical protein ACI88H_003982 [Cocleimonas sp.]